MRRCPADRRTSAGHLLGAAAVLLVLFSAPHAAAATRKGEKIAPCKNPRRLRLGYPTWADRYRAQDRKIYDGTGYTGKTKNHGLWWGWNENRVLWSYLVMHEVTGEARYIAQAARHVDLMLPHARDVNGDGIRLWLDGKGREDPCDYHTSQIGAPIAALARRILDSPTLRRTHGGKARQYAHFVDRNVVRSFESFYGQRWGTFTDGAGVFYSVHTDKKTGKTYRCSRHHNQYASKAKIYLDLGVALNKADYVDRGRMMAMFFKRSMVLEHAGTDREAYRWNYHTMGGEWDHVFTTGWLAKGPEDIGHANTEISFMLKAHREVGVFDERDIRRFVGTVLHLQWNGDEQEPRLHQYMEKGKSYNATGEIWHYVGLARFDGRLLRIFETILDRVYKKPDYYKHLRGDADKAEPAGILLGIARLLQAAKANEAGGPER